MSENPLSVLERLRRMKAESDRKNYREKNQIIQQLLAERADEFEIDDPAGHFWGVTHKPTGFRFHTSPAVAQPLVGRIPATEVKRSAVSSRKVQGLNIAVEYPAGSERTGTNAKGKKWSRTMAHDYGYIRGTVGRDKEHVDIFIGPDPEHKQAYVVNQVDPATGRFDEHKVCVGFASESEARRGYLANYPSGWKGLGSIKAMTIDELKSWLADGDLQKRARGDRPFTVAVDLDGTLAEDGEYVPDRISPPRKGVREIMRHLRSRGAKLCINTVRGDETLVADWLEEHGIPYDEINKNSDQPDGTSHKIIADAYVDDRAVNAAGPVEEWGQELLDLMDEHEREGPRDKKQRLKHYGLLRVERTTIRFGLPGDFVIDNEMSGDGDRLPGGLADGKPDTDFPLSALLRGQRTEQEHVSDPAVAKEIAKDHLTEMPDYYARLEEMEREAESEKSGSIASRAVRAQLRAPLWDSSRGVLENLTNNLSATRRRGREMVGEQDALLDLRSKLEPGFALRRFQNFARQGDPVTPTLPEQLAFR